LAGRPGYEARETFAGRVRSTASRSASLEQWAVLLLESVGSRLESLRTEDALWWRGFCRVHGEVWRVVRTDTGLTDVCQGAALLSELIHQLPKKEAA
jgi:hypothetical protein